MQDDNSRLPRLAADTNTNERRYRREAQPPSSAPLVLCNGWKDEFSGSGKKEEVADILFEGVNFMVRTAIRDRLLPLDLPGVFMHPSIYIDDHGEWHEDYWFLTIPVMWDCWDRDNSTFDDEPVQFPSGPAHDVYTYSFNAKLLAATPLQDRLLFQMGGTMSDLVVCHESVTGIFRGNGANGARLVPVTEY